MTETKIPESPTKSWVRELLPGQPTWVVDLITEEFEKLESKLTAATKQIELLKQMLETDNRSCRPNWCNEGD